MNNYKTSTDVNKAKGELGHALVMTHSLFSDVVQIGCTRENPEQYAKSLSDKTIGNYNVAFALQCDDPCEIKSRVKSYLSAKKYVSDFYQVSPESVAKLLKRETLKIPALNIN